jgi:hypothetical protein
VTVDYAHTSTAERRRLEKAEALAAAARSLEVGASGLTVGGGRRRDVWKAAGLKRPPSEDTWLAVVDVLGLPDATGRAPGPAKSGTCLFHPTRPGRLYLGGYRCEDCSPATLAGHTVPRPPPGTTFVERIAAARSATPTDFEPWVVAAREASPAHRAGSAAARARLATRVYLLGLHHPGPRP